jgi:hypothetical protein
VGGEGEGQKQGHPDGGNISPVPPKPPFMVWRVLLKYTPSTNLYWWQLARYISMGYTSFGYISTELKKPKALTILTG